MIAPGSESKQRVINQVPGDPGSTGLALLHVACSGRNRPGWSALAGHLGIIVTVAHRLLRSSRSVNRDPIGCDIRLAPVDDLSRGSFRIGLNPILDDAAREETHATTRLCLVCPEHSGRPVPLWVNEEPAFRAGVGSLGLFAARAVHVVLLVPPRPIDYLASIQAQARAIK